jgi:hypothetical protein
MRRVPKLFLRPDNRLSKDEAEVLAGWFQKVFDITESEAYALIIGSGEGIGSFAALARYKGVLKFSGSKSKKVS